MKMIDRLSVKFHHRLVGTLSLTPDNKLCAFEYSAQWLAEGFSISPFELPLNQGLFIARPTPFYGGFGIFEDCLPDGYGRYLLRRMLMKEGVDDRNLSTIQRLSLVGSFGMGALTYEPETSLGKEFENKDFDLLQQKALEVLREKNDEDAAWLLFNSQNSGGCRPKAVFSDESGHWLVKFRHTYDPLDMGAQEYHYNEAARRCGIDVPDFKLVNGKYFASRRFDISPEGERLHVATAGGLLCISLDNPVLDYSNLLALTGILTKNPQEVEEMFRRMVFNYLTDNKDDHCKNFSFLIRQEASSSPFSSEWRWHLAPAYDLTFCAEGYHGEHATSVNGTGHPGVQDMIAVGTKAKLSAQTCRRIIDEVRSNCGDLLCYELT